MGDGISTTKFLLSNNKISEEPLEGFCSSSLTLSARFFLFVITFSGYYYSFYNYLNRLTFHMNKKWEKYRSPKRCGTAITGISRSIKMTKIQKESQYSDPLGLRFGLKN